MQGFVRGVALDVIGKDGSRVPVVMHATAQRDETGALVSIRTTLFDATDRRRYERELLEARRRAEQLAAVVQASPDAILTLSPDGTVQTWNPGAEQLFGFTAHEAIGRRTIELFVPEHRVADHEANLSAVRSGREIYVETELVHQDGHRLDVSVRSTPHVEALGEVQAISAIVRDIGELRGLQAKIRRAERLEALGTLAGGVAHELNNQMTVVLGYGELVRGALGPSHPRSADVGRIVEAATRASFVSRQLLAFGQRQRMSLVPVDLHDLVAELLPSLAREAGPERAVELAPRGGPDMALADPAMVEQVVSSLVANAIAATGPGGRIRVAVEAAPLTQQDVEAHPGHDVVPGPYVRLSVTDSGAGMDEATLTRVFEPFFTTRQPGSGSGLGLPSTLGIVKQQRGYVWIDSARGRGTTVRVYLPEAEGAAHPDAHGIVGTPRAAPKSVLVVEDEPTLRMLARLVLQEAGLDVQEAANGREALELLERARPDLVLTDIVMPELNGHQLGDTIRSRWPALRVVYMSGYSAQEMRSRQLLEEDAPFLQKPFSPADLVAMVTGI